MTYVVLYGATRVVISTHAIKALNSAHAYILLSSFDGSVVKESSITNNDQKTGVRSKGKY